MTTEERRQRRYKKIKARQRIVEQSGLRGGTLYEKHREKINRNKGYLAKHGTLLHYANGTNPPSRKTRNRKAWSGTNNWSKKDLAKMQNMDIDQMENYY